MGSGVGKSEHTNSLRSVFLTIAKIWKQTRCPPIDKWIKMWYVYTTEYCSAIKKNKSLPFAATWVDLEGSMLSEISQTEKDKCDMTSLICGF